MATAKKTVSVTKNPPTNSPSVRLNLSSWRKSVAKSYNKNPGVYKGGFAIIVIVIVVGVLAWYNKGLFVAGTINGNVVTTPSFYNRLVKADGSQVFDSLVQETLVKQEASKKKITASKAEIDKKVAALEKNLGGKENLDVALTQNNTTMDQLRQQLEMQILVEKILSDQIKVTDAEITKYIDDNKATNPNLTHDQASQQVKNQKLNDKFTTWYADLKNKAKINKFF
jgi:parvulin-like peptidyl-prolyl isomerase